ncbi:MAG: autotransporter domain-containing protein [Candidatus Protistobacter heckmanni]|nr:autotransporter domain-containing protein [Candidatus Protistobacter heckmanni]
MASLQDAALPFAQEPFGGPAGSHVCGGVMVGAGLVLTAPHCVTSDDLDNDTVVAKAPTSVWVGGPDRRQPGRSAGAKGLLILMTELDGLALVMLDQPRFAGEVIRVAGKDDIQAGAMGLALGWGMTRKARPGENAAALKSPVLKQLALQILSLPQTLAVPVGSPTDLEQYGSSADMPLAESTLIATAALPGYDQTGCAGDSGGPLLIRRGGAWMSAGNMMGSFTNPRCGLGITVFSNNRFDFERLMRMLGASPALPLSSYADTPRRQAVASAIDRLRGRAAPELQAAFGQLLLDNADGIAASLDALHPGNLADAYRLGDTLSASFSALAARRLADWRHGNPAGLSLSGLRDADGGKGPGPGLVHASLSRGDRDALDQARERWNAALGRHTAGSIEGGLLDLPGGRRSQRYRAGVEHRFAGVDGAADLVLGAGASYVAGSVQGWHAVLFAGRQTADGWHFAASAGLGKFSQDGSRLLSLSNGEAAPANTRFSYTVSHAGAEAGKAFRFADARGNVSPFLRADLQRTAVDDYAETGKTPMRLSVQARSSSAVSAGAGVRMDWTEAFNGGWLLRPSLELSLSRTLHRSGADYTASFIDAACASAQAGCGFSGSAAPARGSVISGLAIEAGLALHRRKNMQWNLGYRALPFGGAGQRPQELHLNAAYWW